MYEPPVRAPHPWTRAETCGGFRSCAANLHRPFGCCLVAFGSLGESLPADAALARFLARVTRQHVGDLADGLSKIRLPALRARRVSGRERRQRRGNAGRKAGDDLRPVLLEGLLQALSDRLLSLPIHQFHACLRSPIRPRRESAARAKPALYMPVIRVMQPWSSTVAPCLGNERQSRSEDRQERLFNRHLVNDAHARRFLVLYDASGWAVIEKEDSAVLRHVRRSRWRPRETRDSAVRHYRCRAQTLWTMSTDARSSGAPGSVDPPFDSGVLTPRSTKAAQDSAR